MDGPDQMIAAIASIKDNLDEDLYVGTSALEDALQTLEGLDDDQQGADLDFAAERLQDAAADLTALIDRLERDRYQLEQLREELEQAAVDAHERQTEAGERETVNAIFGV